MGEAIQHLRAFTQTLNRFPVIFLIQKESGFLPFFDIDHVFDTVFCDFHIGIEFRADEAFCQFHSFLLSYFGIASFVNTADLDSVFVQKFFQNIDDLFFHFVDSKGKRLHDQHVFEFVDYQSRKEIRFSEDHTAAARIHRFLSVFPRIAHTHFEKLMIDLLLLFSCHHTDADFGIHIDKSSSHSIAVIIMNNHNVPVFKFSDDRGDLIIENPCTSGFQ